jgi:hypothetical protein
VIITPVRRIERGVQFRQAIQYEVHRRTVRQAMAGATPRRPPRSASRRIASNNSTRDPTPPPPRLEKHRCGDCRGWGQITPSQTPACRTDGAK